jgi:hypothetical protein
MNVLPQVAQNALRRGVTAGVSVSWGADATVE